MARTAVQKISRDVQDAASDIRHAITKATPRIRENGQDMAEKAVRRIGSAARGFATEAGTRSKIVATRAVREAKARPVATGVIAGAAAALIGLAFFFARRKSD